MIETSSWQDNPTLIGVLATICTASLPALGWMARMVSGMDGRITKVETMIEERKPAITEMHKTQITDGNRLVMVEASLETLKRLQESADRAFAAISLKLDCLPRIEETLVT
jgi:predicted phage tail protein